MPATHVTNAVAGTSVPSQMTLIHSAHYAITLVIPVLDHQLTNVPHVRLVSKKNHQEKVMRRRRNVLISTNVLKQPASVDSELTVLTLKDHTPAKLVMKLASIVSVPAIPTVLSVSGEQL